MVVTIFNVRSTTGFTRPSSNLTGRTVEVCDTDELVALGAARQAAAVFTGEWPAWMAGVGATVVTTLSDDARLTVLERYAERRDAEG